MTGNTDSRVSSVVGRGGHVRRWGCPFRPFPAAYVTSTIRSLVLDSRAGRPGSQSVHRQLHGRLKTFFGILFEAF